jgi:MscS family membrane protein
MMACGLLTGWFAAVPQAVLGQTSKEFEPADTSSPRATLRSFIDSCNSVYEMTRSRQGVDRASTKYHPQVLRILDCMDVSALPEFERLEAAGEAAVCLKEVLDRFELPPFAEIPDSDEIAAAASDEDYRHWRIPGTRLTIVRVEEGPQRHEYLFSTGTVDRAVQNYRDVRALPYRTTGPATSPRFYEWYLSTPGHPLVARLLEWLPDWWRGRALGMARWQVAGLCLAILLTVFLMGLAYRLFGKTGAWYRDKAPIRYCLTLVFPLLAILTADGLTFVAKDWLSIRSTPLYVVSFTSSLVVMLALIVFVFLASSRITALILASPKVNPRGLDAQFVRIISRFISVVLAVIIFLEGGNFLGVPITTLMASAGVGGLAFALAAQDMLKNLFGTIMLLMDKPFRVGERIIFKTYDGFVEDIGLRSTRLRLLDGNQATIPNDELARNDIENVGRRPHIRRLADIRIPLNTSREKLEKALEIVRIALQDHDGMRPEFPPRVFFLDFQPDAFVVRMIYWYAPADYWNFVALGEKINLEIFRSFDEHGIQFSLPVRVAPTTIDSQKASVDIRITHPAKAGDAP